MSVVVNQQVMAWLGRKLRGQVTLWALAGLGLTVLGAAVVFVTFCVVYGVTWQILHSAGVGRGYVWLIAGAVVLLLFVGNARTDRAYLEELSFTTGTFSDEVVTFYLPGVGLVSNINPLAPDTIHSYVKMITTCLYSGPRLLTGAMRVLLTATRLATLDRAGCAAVITHLYARAERTAYADIVAAVPGIDPVTVFPQISRIDGVLVLRNEPQGLALSERLTDELRRVMR